MNPQPPSLLRKLFIWSFHLFPHRWVSAVAYWLSRIEQPAIKNLMIRGFVALFRPRMEEATVEDPQVYPSVNALFTRALKDGARTWPADPGTMAAPCDSRVSQFGRIESGRILQAKGQTFTANELLGGIHPEFQGAQFITLYLAPDDCHRLYMPASGSLREMRHIPGRQFTVDPDAAMLIPRLYARNERVVCLFDGADGAPLAVVMVGALNVASIATSWCGIVAPRNRAISHWQYGESRATVALHRGDELGCFHLGSTVVVLNGNAKLDWDPAVMAGEKIAIGQALLVPQATAANEHAAG